MAAGVRFFTLDEANACLPRLRHLIEEIQQVRQEVATARPELWPVFQKAVNNGGRKRASELFFLFQRLERAVNEIKGIGCVLKDIDTGLVDFLSKRDEREVYLCWRYGEDEIRYWHDLHTGFAGRQPLDG